MASQDRDYDVPVVLTSREIWAIVFATEYAEKNPIANQTYKDLLLFIRVKLQSAAVQEQNKQRTGEVLDGKSDGKGV
jgi:hypothetical protein